jgi:hypothetical protein
MFVSFTATTDTAIIAIIITQTFIVNVIDHEILTPINFIGIPVTSKLFSTISGEI